MNTREFMRLPLGKHKITDGIWNYDLIKSQHRDDADNQLIPIYVITTENYSGRITLFEETEKMDEPDITAFRPILPALSSLGGLSVHQDDSFMMLMNLKLIPTGSFAEFIKRTKILDNE